MGNYDLQSLTKIECFASSGEAFNVFLGCGTMYYNVLPYITRLCYHVFNFGDNQ